MLEKRYWLLGDSLLVGLEEVLLNDVKTLESRKGRGGIVLILTPGHCIGPWFLFYSSCPSCFGTPWVFKSTAFHSSPGPITNVVRPGQQWTLLSLSHRDLSGLSTSLSGSASLLYGIYLTSFLAAANVDWNTWNYWVFTVPLGGDFKLNIMFCLVCGATEDFLKAVE